MQETRGLKFVLELRRGPTPKPVAFTCGIKDNICYLVRAMTMEFLLGLVGQSYCFPTCWVGMLFPIGNTLASNVALISQCLFLLIRISLKAFNEVSWEKVLKVWNSFYSYTHFEQRDMIVISYIPHPSRLIFLME